MAEGKMLLDVILSWANSVSAAPKSALGKAQHYLKEQRPYLIRYLEDGRLELSNNWAEAQYQALCAWPEELPVCQHPAGCPGQRGDLQMDQDGQGN